MYSLKSCHFTTKNGNKYTIIKTVYGNSRSLTDAIDTIKNSKGETRSMSRLKTIEFINS